MNEEERDTRSTKQSRLLKDFSPAELAAMVNRIAPPLFASGVVAFPTGRGFSANPKGWLPDLTKLTTSVVPGYRLPTPEDLLPKAVALANEGWFYDPQIAFTDFEDAHEALSEGNVVEADEIMSEHFARQAQEIEQRLVKKYPARALVLSQAFVAHRSDQHALSVLAFLAQADGVCCETRDGHFFLRDNNSKHRKKNEKSPRQTAAYVERKRREVWDGIVLAALELDLPILKRMSKIGAGGDAFNRHSILHGKSVAYGTLTNSFKAISLLNYVAFGADTDGQPAV